VKVFENVKKCLFLILKIDSQFIKIRLKL